MDTPMTHMHQEPLALHDSFLNFCPLSASCSVTLGGPVSQFVSMYVKQKGREIQFALSSFHTTSVPCCLTGASTFLSLSCLLTLINVLQYFPC